MLSNFATLTVTKDHNGVVTERIELKRVYDENGYDQYGFNSEGFHETLELIHNDDSLTQEDIEEIQNDPTCYLSKLFKEEQEDRENEFYSEELDSAVFVSLFDDYTSEVYFGVVVRKTEDESLEEIYIQPGRYYISLIDRDISGKNDQFGFHELYPVFYKKDHASMIDYYELALSYGLLRKDEILHGEEDYEKFFDLENLTYSEMIEKEERMIEDYSIRYLEAMEAALQQKVYRLVFDSYSSWYVVGTPVEE